MLNIFLSVADVTKGFPDVSVVHRVRFNKLGNFEEALADCVVQFREFSDRLSSGHALKRFSGEIIEGMEALTSANDMATSASEVTNELGTTRHIVIVVSKDI